MVDLAEGIEQVLALRGEVAYRQRQVRQVWGMEPEELGGGLDLDKVDQVLPSHCQRLLAEYREHLAKLIDVTPRLMTELESLAHEMERKEREGE